ncbi:MAG: tetratricopeptide repeat protein [Proteobacteria bacterium]|nr:tetratricopeptide repeat protein [Pseudomonadota bacterium]
MLKLVRLTAVAWCLLLCLPPLSKGDAVINSLKLTYEGHHYHSHGDLTKALKYYNEAIKLSFSNLDAYYNRGMVYVKLNKYRSAIKDFNWVIAFEPKNILARYSRAFSYFELKDYRKSINDFKIVIELLVNRPNSSQQIYLVYSYGLVATCHYRLGKYKHAITYFSKALRLKPKDEDILYDRGVAYFDSRQYQMALADFTKAIRLKPDFAEAYLERGRVFFELNLYKKAVRDLNRAIALRHDFAEQYILRGLVHLMSGNLISAGKDFLTYFLLQFK